MKPLIISLNAALQAETLKTRRTLALSMALLAPIAVGFLVFVMFLQMGPSRLNAGAGEGGAWRILLQNGHVFWSLLMLPLFVTLEMGLLANLEHANQTWKHLYALPLPRWTVYAAKWVVGLALIGLSTVVLMGVLLLTGKLLAAINPAYGFSAAIPLASLLRATLVSYLCAWLIVAIHLWVSVRFPSFVVAMGAGVVATIAGVMVFDSKYAPFYPWTLSGVASLNALHGESFTASLLLGVLGGLALGLLGCWEATRREMA